MTLGPQEIVRSEMEGGLSGPANSVTAESIDCGCGRYQLPRLAKFATRRIFLALLYSIGVLQAAAQAYFCVTSSTVARSFQLDPYLMEWILCVSEITPIIFGLIIAYWGDRIHRASWLGGLTLIECAAFFSMLIPYFSHWVRVIEEPENVTHMSIYGDESPDLCMKMSSRIIAKENIPQYSTLFILIVAQVIMGIANIAYYALGISYLDDNTKRIHVSVYLGVALASKLLGSVVGYMMGWGFLRIDAFDFSPIKSYREQIGAWWLGWIIFTILLAIPGCLMAIFPRKLPSEMIEQAAATILDQSGTLRGSQRIPVKKVGSTEFLSSMLRLITNKILIFNVLAGAFFITALINFIANENIFLESRFYAPRPTGLLLGFGDPIITRTITTIMKPLLIGLTIIITGLVIARAKPKARTLVNYSFIILLASALIILCLAFNKCQKARIVGAYKQSFTLNKYCNKDCKCSRDADFRPICYKGGTYTFYSPCHAGCTSLQYENNVKVYTNCSCAEDGIGLGNYQGVDGPCSSDNCQVGWIIYEIFTMLVYAAAASIMVGDLLISLRSVNIQDKALTIGYSMAFFGFFAYVPGKLIYDELVKSTCQHWGANDHICHLHHPNTLGNYLCFLTAGLIIVSVLFKIGVWIFCSDLEIYDPIEEDVQEPIELKDISKTQTEPLLQTHSNSNPEDHNGNQRSKAAENVVEPIVIIEHKKKATENGPIADIIDEGEASGSCLKYGPVGPGDRRTVRNQSNINIATASTDDELGSSDGSHVPREGSISYKRLEIDSDVESDLSGTAPRSRKRISRTEMDDGSNSLPGIRSPFTNLRFPNPDNYEDPRIERSLKNISPNFEADGSSKTNSFEYAKKRKDDKPLPALKGDFNEVGIPLVESYEVTIKNSSGSLRSPTVMMAIQQLDRNLSHEMLEHTRLTHSPTRKSNLNENDENRKFRLEKLMQPVNYASYAIRPPSRDQSSSGFGSLLDVRERTRHSDISDSRDSLSSKSSKSGPLKKGFACTDL